MEFEKKLLKLDEIVGKLENKDISIDDGIKLFEDGLNITKDCLKDLNEAKGRIAIIKEEMGKLNIGEFE